MSRVPELRFPGFTEEWRDVKLGDICEPPKYGLNAPATKFRTDLPAYLRITDITEDGRYIKENKVSVDIEDFYEYILKEGDLVFARTGATVGKTYLYKKEDGLLVYAGYLIKFSPKPNLAVARFIKFFTETPKYWKWVSIVSVRSGQPGINSQEYSSMRLFIPSLPEQQKIADFLTAVDEKIETVEAKIDRLERYKKGVMQKLLSGEVRFPGFTEEWREVRLGEICDVMGGGTPDTKNPSYWNGNIPWFTPTEIKKRYCEKSKRTITENGLNNSSAKLLPIGTILLTTRATIGDACVTIKECTTNQGFQNLIAKKAYSNNVFLYYWILTKRYELLKRANGSTFLEISNKEIKRLKIFIPSLPEQQKIADFLTTVDDKIDTEKARLEALKAYKKGLLQKMFV